MDIELHQNDLPDSIDLGKIIAVDTETMGLNLLRDRLCLVQLSAGDGVAHLVQFPASRGDKYDAPNLKALLADRHRIKLYHFARFDLAAISQYLGVSASPVYCTRTASRLVRTFTDRHGLKDLCHDLLRVDISKQQQSSDWGADNLSREQLEYAANDVLFLHEIKLRLDDMLARHERTELAQACFDFLPARAALDLAGWPEVDLLAHS
ncbi:MAG: ribonuclease D [Alphaproteobacteria bacterium]|nr:ribonuclease D [Alphaproteobacteria bacterium]HCP01291.1 ribonuclease D [Rhodospirillaceae bacterium]